MLMHDCTGSSCQFCSWRRHDNLFEDTEATATVDSTLCGVQLTKEQTEDSILSQVECPLKVMEPVIVSSSAFHTPASSTSSAKSARSYSSPKGAAAVKMVMKSSMAQKTTVPLFQISGGSHITINFK